MRETTVKQKVLDAVGGLPDDATFEDAIERIVFISKVSRGLEDAEAGRTTPHSEVKKQLLK